MKKAASTESKSLKTFYLYLFIVVLIVIGALLVKGFFIIQRSRFDPSHNFTLAVTENEKVKEIISFHPQVPAISLLSIQDTNIVYPALAKDYGISTDGFIQITDASDINTDITSFMWASILHAASWQSDLTLFDKIRLFLFSKNVTANNNTVENISLPSQNSDVVTAITNTLTDQEIADENISIQIVNATNITGFGQRLSRVLTNMGANVVEVSTAQNIQRQSTMQYFGNKSYTVERLQKLLGIKANKITTQQIADIIIVLGVKEEKTQEF